MATSLLLPLQHSVIHKPRAATIVWEAGAQLWTISAQQEHVMDNIHDLSILCEKSGAKMAVGVSSASKVITVSLSGDNAAQRRAALLSESNRYVVHKTILTLVPDAFYQTQHHQSTRQFGRWNSGADHQYPRQDAVAILSQLSAECHVAVMVVTRANNLTLEIVGRKPDVAVARYKANVIVDSLRGLGVSRLELPYELQPLLLGPKRCHLQLIFDQTGVNVYVPPVEVPLDEIHLTGEPVQLSVAKHMFRDICSRTSSAFEQTLKLPFYTYEWLMTDEKATAGIQALEIRYAAHVSLSSVDRSRVAKITACTQELAQKTVDALATLIRAAVYIATLDDRSVSAHSRAKLDWTQAADVVSKTGVSIARNNKATSDSNLAPYAIHGPAAAVKRALGLLCCSSQPEWAQPDWSCTLSFDVEASLREFYAGKKNGKISKIASSSGSQVWFTPAAEQTPAFTVHVAHLLCSQFLSAIALLEDELPAERLFFVPESFHKQVIGIGGSRIQSIMRRHNVYVKFSTSTEASPNAQCRHNVENVIIRCPSKNASHLEAASQELMQSVNQYDREFGTTYLLLTRSQRRYLIANRASTISEIERKFNAVVKLPVNDSRATELLEICAPHTLSQAAARQIQLQLPLDFEFRIAASPNFAAAIGPDSSFAAKVVAPLRVCFDAYVQTYSRVQMKGDSATYSQILVTLGDRSGYALEEITKIVTQYVRQHDLDIVDRGELHADVIVDGSAAANSDNLNGSALPIPAFKSTSHSSPVKSSSKTAPRLAELKNWQPTLSDRNAKISGKPTVGSTPNKRLFRSQGEYVAFGTQSPLRSQPNGRAARQPGQARFL